MSSTSNSDPIFWGMFRDAAYARKSDPLVARWGYLGAWSRLSVVQKRMLIRGLLEGSPLASYSNAHGRYVAMAQTAGNTVAALNYAADTIARAIDADNLRRLRKGMTIPGINEPITTSGRPLPAGQASGSTGAGSVALWTLGLAAVGFTVYRAFR